MSDRPPSPGRSPSATQWQVEREAPPDDVQQREFVGDEEHDARLAADADLRDELAREEFSGAAYGVFEDELAKSGYAAMIAMLRSGEMFARCRRQGLGLGQRPLTAEDREDLASETIVRALPVFKQKALVEGRWQPKGGATLKSFFISSLPLQFANVYRAWLNRQPQDAHPYDELPEATLPSPRSPEEIVLQREDIRSGLVDLPETTRTVLVLHDDGYDHAEIAEILGTTPRAVEGRLSRHRKKIQARLGQEGS